LANLQQPQKGFLHPPLPNHRPQLDF
jgi:hypothetical protein